MVQPRKSASCRRPVRAGPGQEPRCRRACARHKLPQGLRCAAGIPGPPMRGASPIQRARSSSTSQRTWSTSQLISPANCTSPSMRMAGLSPRKGTLRQGPGGDSSVTSRRRSRAFRLRAPVEQAAGSPAAPWLIGAPLHQRHRGLWRAGAPWPRALLHQDMVDEQHGTLVHLGRSHWAAAGRPDDAIKMPSRNEKGDCVAMPRLFPELGLESLRYLLQGLHLPATSQPLVPDLLLVMFHTFAEGLGPADSSSRIMPENSAGHVAIVHLFNAQQLRLIITTSVWLGSRPRGTPVRAVRRISSSMPSVIMERSVAMSERSQAACKVTKLRLAADTKPSASKPAGMPQFCEPAEARTDHHARPWAGEASNAMLLRSQGRADASLPTFQGMVWAPALPPQGWKPQRPGRRKAKRPTGWRRQGGERASPCR